MNTEIILNNIDVISKFFNDCIILANNRDDGNILSVIDTVDVNNGEEYTVKTYDIRKYRKSGNLDPENVINVMGDNIINRTVEQDNIFIIKNRKYDDDRNYATPGYLLGLNIRLVELHGSKYYHIVTKDESHVLSDVCIDKFTSTKSISNLNDFQCMLYACCINEHVWKGSSTLKFIDEDGERIVNIQSFWDRYTFILQDYYDDDICLPMYYVYDMEELKYLFANLYERINDLETDDIEFTDYNEYDMEEN